ncbi:MAG: acylphosphatase [Geminicoccaceae bacterium]
MGGRISLHRVIMVVDEARSGHCADLGQGDNRVPMATEKLIIRGALGSGDFPDWIVHRARRLGLRGGITRIGAQAIETLVAGPPDLIDAMEVGCSLGPTSVEVERIDRTAVDFDIGGSDFAYVLEDDSRPAEPRDGPR